MSTANNRKVKRDLEKWRIKEGDNFDKKLTKVCKLASVQLQRKINGNIDKPTNFTQNAVGFKFNRTSEGTVNTIFIKDIQAKYLKPYIEGECVTKMQPVAEDRKNQFGNIKSLKSKRYVKVKHKNGKEILIDPKKKRNKKGVSKRLVAIKETNTRRAVLGNWESNAKEIIRMVNNRMKLI